MEPIARYRDNWMEVPREFFEFADSIHSKKYGRFVDDKFILHPIEAFHLVERNKLGVQYEGRILNKIETLKLALSTEPKFILRYIVYCNLRSRGRNPRIYPDRFKFRHGPIYIFSESDFFDLEYLKERAELNKKIYAALVDEEGDMTYYMIKIKNLKRDTPIPEVPRIEKGILIGDRVLIDDRSKLYENTSLSMTETAYLLKKHKIRIETLDGENVSYSKLTKYAGEKFKCKFIIYEDLRDKGYIVNTGFKYGAFFRVYSPDREEEHAKYLVHFISKRSTWAEASRAVRVAHSVKKKMIFPYIYKDGDKRIEYLQFSRIKP